MGGEVACPSLSPQGTWEKARSQTTDIVQILFEAFPLLPQISTPKRLRTCSLPPLLEGSLPSAPYLAPRSPHPPPPESAALCSAAGGQTVSSPVRTLQTQVALPEAKDKLKGQRLSPPTPL